MKTMNVAIKPVAHLMLTRIVDHKNNTLAGTTTTKGGAVELMIKKEFSKLPEGAK